jgi:hypothetical protein
VVGGDAAEIAACCADVEPVSVGSLGGQEARQQRALTAAPYLGRDFEEYGCGASGSGRNAADLCCDAVAGEQATDSGGEGAGTTLG